MRKMLVTRIPAYLVYINATTINSSVPPPPPHSLFTNHSRLPQFTHHQQTRAMSLRMMKTGFSIKIPNNVKRRPSAHPTVVIFKNTNSMLKISGFLYPTSMQAGDLLEIVGQTALDYQTGGLDNLDILKNEEILLESGVKAWYSQIQGYLTEYKYTIEVRVYTIIHNNRAVTLMFYSLPENFMGWDKTIKAMLDSINLSAPSVMGFPRNEIFNPRRR